MADNLRAKGLTEGITITSRYEDCNGESYETAWMINSLLSEGSGYSEYKGYEDQVQAPEDQSRALEWAAGDIRQVISHRYEDARVSTETARRQGVPG